MPVEIRHQVFVSSTFTDLQDERREVIDGLLELDCFPCGMEYFPADNEGVWQVIQRLIDGCDYYVLIVAARYGSTDKDGISFTQKEYEYAVSKNIPVLAFLRKDLGSVTLSKAEEKTTSKKKLEEFRQQLSNTHLCKTWDSASDLRAKVVSSLVSARKVFPKPGWVRADHLPDESAAQMMNRLRSDAERLREENQALKAQNQA